MRTFEYKCTDCGKKKDFFENYEDKEKEHICDCGGEMKRIISTPNFHFTNKPKNFGMPHSKRRAIWNSKDTRDKLEITS